MLRHDAAERPDKSVAGKFIAQPVLLATEILPRTRKCLDIKSLDAKISAVSAKTPPKAADSSGTHLWLILMKAHRTLARHARQSIEALNMCFSDFAIMELLLHRGEQPVSAIGRRIELTSGAITTAVDRLEARGFVCRSSDSEDRRSRLVSLTKQGKAQISEVFAHHKRAMDRAASGLSKEEREKLIVLMKKLGLTAEQQLSESVDET